MVPDSEDGKVKAIIFCRTLLPGIGADVKLFTVTCWGVLEYFYLAMKQRSLVGASQRCLSIDAVPAQVLQAEIAEVHLFDLC